MKLNRIFLGALGALAIVGAPVWAQGADEKEPVETTEATEATAEAPAEAAPVHDVWWGNRSISWGNYLKFDRINVDAMAPAAAPMGPTVFDSLHFDKDKSVIRPEARAVLSDVILLLQNNSAATAVVELEASATPLSAAELGLAQRRAEAVRNYLIENGIAAERVTTATAGEAQVSGTATAIIPISNR